MTGRHHVWRALRGAVIVIAAACALLQDGGWFHGGPRLAHAAAGNIARSVAAGGYHTCVVTSSGTGGAKCFGLNSSGQLGDGTTTSRNRPTQVMGLTTGVTSVVAGEEHTCALLFAESGSVKCWGSNAAGQLGDNTNTDRTTPVWVCAPGATAPCDSSNNLQFVSALTAGEKHTCARLSSGEVVCWGSNHAGQLGDGTTTNRDTPVYACTSGSGPSCVRLQNIRVATPPFAASAAGVGFSCAQDNSGIVWCWGDNTAGQLGDGSNLSRSIAAPVCASGTIGVDCAPFTVPGGSRIAAGDGHVCSASSGVFCWGRNNFGQLGDGMFSDRVNPVNVCQRVEAGGCAAGYLAGAGTIDAGTNHTCADLDTRVVCWGDASFGQLGDDSSFGQQAVPVTALDRHTASPFPAYAVSVGGFHSCAIYSASAPPLLCWGLNQDGQIGIRESPVTGGISLQSMATDVYGFGDMDRDRFWDYWELTGDLDDDGDVDLPLPAMGADPQVKDIFVEVDWMDCAVAGSTGCPDPAHSDGFQTFVDPAPPNQPSPALIELIRSFWCAPERIKIHIDAGEHSIMDPVVQDCGDRGTIGGARWGTLSAANPLAHVETYSTCCNAIRTANFSNARADVFHYAVLIHDTGGVHPNGRPFAGAAVDVGRYSDFYVSLGAYVFPTPPPTSTQLWHAQTSVFMHELGHTLGLDHGGPLNVLSHAQHRMNGKPNYLSIMNYNFGGVGLLVNGTYHQNYDYSRSALSPLSETSMNEVSALEPDGLVAFGGRVYGTIWKCANGGGVVNFGEGVAAALDARSNVDFNCSANEGIPPPPLGTCVDLQDNDFDGLRDQLDTNCTFEPLVTSTNLNGIYSPGIDPAFQGAEDWSNFDFTAFGQLGAASASAGPSVANSSLTHADSLDGVGVIEDADSDMLADAAEAANGTSPATADSDGDGIVDGLEIGSFITDPADADTDDDGVPDGADNCRTKANSGQENADAAALDNGPKVPGNDATLPVSDSMGDACDEDADNDGIADTRELTGEACGGVATDPSKADTDGDHLIDVWECQWGSDPTSALSKYLGAGSEDADGDHISDLWELRGYNAMGNSLDSDGDGCADLVELASVDGDRFVTVTDRLAVARRSLNIWGPDPAQDYVLDIDRDGNVGIADRLFVARAQLLPDWQPKSCP